MLVSFYKIRNKKIVENKLKSTNLLLRGYSHMKQHPKGEG